MTYINRGGRIIGKPIRGNRPVGDDEFSIFDISSWASIIPDTSAVTSTDPSVSNEDLISTSAGNNSISTADFVKANGVCKARNFTAMNYAKNLQTQLNRVAQVKGFGKIGIDGDIGSSTLALFAKVQAASSGQVMGDASDCILIAGDSDVLGDQVKTLADNLKAPAVVSGPLLGGNKAGSIITKSGKKVMAPGASASILDSFGEMGGTQKLVLLGLLGGIGYMAFKSTKKKRR